MARFSHDPAAFAWKPEPEDGRWNDANASTFHVSASSVGSALHVVLSLRQLNKGANASAM
jgi:hypothetical protein